MEHRVYKRMIVEKWACLPWRPPWIDLHQIWQSGSPRRPDHPWQFFWQSAWGFHSVRGRILPFSYLQAVAINTGLVLPRSLWWQLLHSWSYHHTKLTAQLTIQSNTISAFTTIWVRSAMWSQQPPKDWFWAISLSSRSPCQRSTGHW